MNSLKVDIGIQRRLKMYGYNKRQSYSTYKYNNYNGNSRYKNNNYSKGKFSKYKKLSPYTNTITQSTQGPTVISDKQFVKMKYCVPFTITEVSTNFFSDFLYGNGFNSNTQLPPGIQNWAAFYTKYRIFGSKLKITFANMGAQNLVVGLLARTDNTVPLSNLNVLNQPYCQWKMIAPQSAGNNIKMFSMFMKTKKMVGQKVTQEDDYQGSFTYVGTTFSTAVDPVTPWYWEYFVTSDVNTGIDLKVVAELTYYIQLEDRRLQATP